MVFLKSLFGNKYLFEGKMMRPNPGDYDPYFERYIKLIEGDDIIKILYWTDHPDFHFIYHLFNNPAHFQY